jgi:exonuclease-1
MGVKGLLPELRGIIEHVKLSDFKGQTAGIDALCWLHRGGVTCAKNLVEEVQTDTLTNYFMGMIEILIRNEIKPFVVFDGRPLPVKGQCNSLRQEVRRKNKQLAREAALNGDDFISSKLYARAVTVTSTMIHALIIRLKSSDIEFLVAPYEADAQLAYLSRFNYTDFTISEDSDCIVYGCKRVLFKLSKEGTAEQLNRRDLGSNDTLSFTDWSDDQFKLFCCISGCDYVKFQGLGVRKAHKLVAKCKVFASCVSTLRASNCIDDASCGDLVRALLTFKHQVVFDPSSRRLQHLTPIDASLVTFLFECGHSLATSATVSRSTVENQPSLDFLGSLFGDDVADSIARGAVDPMTLQEYSPTAVKTQGLALSSLLPPVGRFHKNREFGCDDGDFPLGLDELLLEKENLVDIDPLLSAHFWSFNTTLDISRAAHHQEEEEDSSSPVTLRPSFARKNESTLRATEIHERRERLQEDASLMYGRVGHIETLRSKRMRRGDVHIQETRGVLDGLESTSLKYADSPPGALIDNYRATQAPQPVDNWTGTWSYPYTSGDEAWRSPLDPELLKFIPAFAIQREKHLKDHESTKPSRGIDYWDRILLN